MNLREASMRPNVLVDGAAVSAIDTSIPSAVRYGGYAIPSSRRAQRSDALSTTIFSVDDGAWVDGDTPSDGSRTLGGRSEESHEIELGLVRRDVRVDYK